MPTDRPEFTSSEPAVGYHRRKRGLGVVGWSALLLGGALVVLAAWGLSSPAGQGAPRSFVLAAIVLCTISIVGVITALRSRQRMAESGAGHARAEAALRERSAALASSNEELAHFNRVAAHDLKEPLRTMAAYADLLQRRFAGQLDEQSERWIQHIHKSASRLHGLVDDLRLFAEAGRPRDLVEVSADDALDQALENLEQPIMERSARITRQPLPRVMGDAQQLALLFQNLVSNALKYSGEGVPAVDIRAHADGPLWRIAVRDYGEGIDPAFLDQVFEPFARLHTETDIPGTGFGLAICRKVAEGHSGRLFVESEGTGQGATFVLEVPAIAAPAD